MAAASLEYYCTVARFAFNRSDLKETLGVGEKEHLRFKQAVHETCMWLLENKRTADETEIDGKKKELEQIVNNIMAGASADLQYANPSSDSQEDMDGDEDDDEDDDEGDDDDGRNGGTTTATTA